MSKEGLSTVLFSEIYLPFELGPHSEAENSRQRCEVPVIERSVIVLEEQKEGFCSWGWGQGLESHGIRLLPSHIGPCNQLYRLDFIPNEMGLDSLG